MDNPAEGVSRTFMSSQTQGTPSTSPYTAIGHEDDVIVVTSQHGTGGSLAHYKTPVSAGMSAAAHADLVHEVNSLRETLKQIQRTLDAVQDRLLTFETSQKRTETLHNLLTWMKQPVARPTVGAQAPPDQPETDPESALGGQRKTQGVYANFAVS